MHSMMLEGDIYQTSRGVTGAGRSSLPHHPDPEDPGNASSSFQYHGNAADEIMRSAE